jgi:hypothetical protein
LSVKTCEVCSKRPAFYVCQECGRSVCPVCWRSGFCETCRTRTTASPIADAPFGLAKLLWSLAIPTIIAGCSLIVVGTLLGGTSGGCLVWPFPLIVTCDLGSGTSLDDAGIILIVVFAVSVIVYLSVRGFHGKDATMTIPK